MSLSSGGLLFAILVMLLAVVQASPLSPTAGTLEIALLIGLFSLFGSVIVRIYRAVPQVNNEQIDHRGSTGERDIGLPELG